MSLCNGNPDEPLRISMVIPGLGAGGAEKALSTLANAWAEEGRKITVITLEPKGRFPYHTLDDRVAVNRLGIEPKRVRRDRAIARTLLRIVRLRSAVKESRPDVVISLLTRMNVLTLIATWGSGIPVIVSERNNPTEQKVNWFWELLRRISYERAAAVIGLTTESLAYYSHRINARGEVIPNAFSLPERPAAREGSPVLTATGRLVEQKGFDLLLRAFAQVAPQHSEWNLVIWGEGPERQNLERLRDELGLTKRVRLPGLTRKPQEWTEGSHLFVLSSRYEGLANVLGEAMAAGLPVVAFDCEWGPRKLIQHGINGWLVRSGDVTALADGLDELFGSDPLRDRLACAARASMASFAPQRIVHQWDNVIERVTGSPNRSAGLIASSASKRLP